MATGSGYSVSLSEKFGSDPATDESSESEGETGPTKSFHRRISTSKAIKSGVSFNLNINFGMILRIYLLNHLKNVNNNSKTAN